MNTWKLILLGASLPALGMAQPVFQLVKNPDGSAVNSLAVVGREVFGFFDMHTDLFRTRDLGNSWRRIPAEMPSTFGANELFAAGGSVYVQKIFSPVLVDGDRDTLRTLIKQGPDQAHPAYFDRFIDAGSRLYGDFLILSPQGGTRQFIATVPRNGPKWVVPMETSSGPLQSYAALDDSVLLAWSNKVLYSADAGAHWDTVKNIPADSVLKVDRFSGGFLVATEKGLFAGRNAVESWQKVGPSEFLLPQAVSGKNIVVKNRGGQYRLSMDAGQSWSPVDLPLPTAANLQTHLSDSLLCFTAPSSGKVFCSVLAGEPVAVGERETQWGAGFGLTFTGNHLVFIPPAGIGPVRSGRLKLWNVQGDLVWDRSWQSADGKRVEVDAGTLPRGLYLGAITANGRRFGAKVSVF